MAHTKIFSPSGWDFDVPIASLVKLANSGKLGPNDRLAFIKRAGACGTSLFEKQVAHLKFAKDSVPIHLIALGASEAYGPNRNGDAFSEATLKAAHDTFVKHAFWFRNHKNKPHEGHPKFGLVKASFYNDQMRRVELLCELPTTKEAAERMGVCLADKELEKLAKDDDIAVSMACRVPYDVCSGCRNKARTREEYCKEANCKYGGCTNNLTKLVKIAGDTHILHVDNPNPCFFDISNVFRPADRIAYAGKADWVKAASDGFFGISGVKMAEDLGVTAPLSVVLAQDYLLPGQYGTYLQEQVKLAYALAALDQQPEKWANAFVYRAFTSDVQPELNLEALELTSPKLEKVAAGLGALADQKILLSLRDFSRMTKRASLSADAGNCLKGVYYRMIEDGSLEQRLKENRYAPVEKLASFAQRQAASRIVSTYSLEKTAVETRCQQSVIRGYPAPVSKTTFWIEKKAHDSPLAEGLARDYAIYKIASLRRISQFDSEFLLTARLSACQNQVH